MKLAMLRCSKSEESRHEKTQNKPESLQAIENKDQSTSDFSQAAINIYEIF